MMFDVQRKAQFDVQSISQNFAVSFNYEIYFTDSLFSLKNATLAQVIAFDGERKPKKIIAVVDGDCWSSAGFTPANYELCKVLC